MSGANGNAELWFRRFSELPGSAAQLVCFPHAGGSASFFFPFAGALGSRCEVLAAQYPGRQDRRHEQPIDDLRVLADRLADALTGAVDRPFVLFGHSMGAVVAFEVAQRLEDGGGQVPAGLIVSGRRAPSVHRHEDLHRRSDDVLLAEVRALSGTSAQLLEDEELRQMIIPALRGDYKAIETYRWRHGPKLACPVSVLVGDRDPRVTLEQAQAWRTHTSGAYSFRDFPGGHFYLNERRAAVVAAVSTDIATFTRPGATGVAGLPSAGTPRPR